MFENKRDRFLGCGDAIAKRDLGIAFWDVGAIAKRDLGIAFGMWRAIAKRDLGIAFWEVGGR